MASCGKLARLCRRVTLGMIPGVSQRVAARRGRVFHESVSCG